MKHLLIPDCQVVPWGDLSFLSWVGQYIIAKKPDVIIQIGDFADMESLSSYDKGKKSFEGRRYKKDIEAAHRGMELLLAPMLEYNRQQRKTRHAQYKPRMVLTLGNHEDRINRVSEFQPEYDGMIAVTDLQYEKWGWEVIPFLDVVEIDGVYYSHYFVNPSSLTNNVVSGTIDTKLKNLGHTFTMGHQQQLQYGLRHLSNGDTLQGLVAGACYPYDFDYLGPQKKAYWRGIVMKHRVQNGMYDPCFVSLDWLREKYDV
jgi:hypothetical protein